jgi:hypothetical protein
MFMGLTTLLNKSVSTNCSLAYTHEITMRPEDIVHTFTKALNVFAFLCLINVFPWHFILVTQIDEWLTVIIFLFWRIELFGKGKQSSS